MKRVIPNLLVLLARSGFAFDLPTFSFTQLTAADQYAAAALRSAADDVGAFAVCGDISAVPFSASLEPFRSCLRSRNRTLFLRDLPASGNAQLTVLLPAGGNAPSAGGPCAEVFDTAHGVRSAAQRVGAAYEHFLGVPSGDQEYFYFAQHPSPAVPPAPGRLQREPSVFTVMSPPATAGVETTSGGLRLQLPSGEVVAPRLTTNCLLVVNGRDSVSLGSAAPAFGVVPGEQGYAWYSRACFADLTWGTLLAPLEAEHRTLLAAQSQATSLSSDAFCNANLRPIIMWMTGFQTVGVPGDPCIAVLFPEWALTTAGAFAGACVGIFFMAMATEGLVCLRRWLGDRWPERELGRRRYWAHAALMLVLYGGNVTLGYFLMLIAMTYQVELFIMVIVGLVAGQAAFHTKWGLPKPKCPCHCGPAEAKDEETPVSSTDSLMLCRPEEHPCVSCPTPCVSPMAFHVPASTPLELDEPRTTQVPSLGQRLDQQPAKGKFCDVE